MINPADSTTSGAPHPPFWKDDPEGQVTGIRASKMAERLVIAIGVLMVLSVFGISFGVLYTLAPIWGAAVVLYFIAIFGSSFISAMLQKRKRQAAAQAAAQIQEKAREKSGATAIGSAIHVAGDPHFEREQNVVLALTPRSLDFYRYDQERPVDSLPLEQIREVHTVVYDDERIPHLDTLDGSAQALQISVRYGEGVYDILLRGTRKIRPIDWYQAIQKARIQESS